jgi:hypothetical protein
MSRYRAPQNLDHKLDKDGYTGDAQDLKNAVDSLTAGQTGGLISFVDKATMDAYVPADLLGSYKVTNDPTSSNNGHYHWTGSLPYIKDADLVNGVVESGNLDAVSGDTVYDVTSMKADVSPKDNLFNINTILIDTRTTNNGTQAANLSFDSSDFIPIKENTNYTVNSSVFYSCYYDEDKNVVAGGLSGAASTWLTPVGVSFMITCTLKANTTNLTLVEGLVTPSISPYLLIIPKEQIEVLSIVDETDLDRPINSKSVVDYQHINKTKINPYFRKKTNLVSQTTKDETYVSESSIFTAWGCGVGTRGDFKAVKFFVNSWNESNPITQINIRIRENDYNGTIISEKQVSINDVYQDNTLLVEFDSTVSNANPLWFEFLTDGYSGYIGTVGNLDVGQGSTAMRFLTSKSLTASVTSVISTSPQRVINVEFVNVDDLQIELTRAGRTALRDELQVPQIPRIILPDTIDAVVGYKQQLFYRGIIEAINPYQWNIKVDGNVGGKQFPRYYEFTPTTAGTKTFTIGVYDTYNNLLAENSCTVNIVNPTTNPATIKKVLRVGDSLTDIDYGTTWTEEFRRMIQDTGGTPTGLNLSNYEFIGTKGISPNNSEGYAGKNWDFFNTDAGSPFVFGGSLDFSQYVTTNSFGTIDYALILLTWNGIASRINPKKNAIDHADLITEAKVFLDQLHSDFPSCKVKLMGIQLPSLNGGLAENYGDDNSTLGNYYNLVQTVNGLNLAYQDLVNEVAYSSFVDFVNVSTQFDNENNMPYTLHSVNSRSLTTEKRGSNGVHPSNDGYHQISDIAFRNFNNS